jgi:GH3 auxin-responsive promoter
MFLASLLVKWYLSFHYRKIQRFLENPKKVQEEQWASLLENLSKTAYGKQYEINQSSTLVDFVKNIPISDYEDLKPHIHLMMLGNPNVLWPGVIKWFSKSSGTTSDKSKFIPVSDENLKNCHHRGSHDAMALWYKSNPKSNLLVGKSLIMGGSLSSFSEFPNTTIGDVSAIMIHHLPKYAQFFYTPDLKVALMDEWEKKIESMAQQAAKENITQLGGVPTWTLVLMRRLLEIKGKSNINEVFPNFELYTHGGVSFEPYKEQFAKLLPDSKTQYREVYNASEGFFAVQAEKDDNGMLLLLDNGVYYEFIPMDAFMKGEMNTIGISEVKIDVNYALVISTNAGLWRYLIGDTIRFTETEPYKIKITGRTKQFINAFGEEVMVENTDKALVETCKAFDVEVVDYTVAPIYMSENGKGGHEWLIEFVSEPENLSEFGKKLDMALQQINSDYEAKRYKNIALDSLKLTSLSKGSFLQWLKMKGKIGGQHKVPRLSNDRNIVDTILEMKKI